LDAHIERKEMNCRLNKKFALKFYLYYHFEEKMIIQIKFIL
jgi:hypothetical protein